MIKRLTAILLACFLLLSGCNGINEGSSSPLNCTHADEDDNGACDLCSENVIVTVDVYNVNDLHGKIVDGNNHPGVDELSSYLQRCREKSEKMLLLSSGDMWQGTIESNMTGGRIVTDWMNEMDFAAMTLGEHEFSWGEEAIRENSNLADFPFLAINVYDRETNQRVSYCQSSTLVNCGAVQIGVIGAAGDFYSDISPDRVEDIYFKTGDELTELIKEESRKLRTRGADFVILSVHNGFDVNFYDISLSYGYVDLVFEGRTHQMYELQDEHGVTHMQGGGDNRGITHAKIAFNIVTGTHFLIEHVYLKTSVYDSMRSDPIVETLLRKYEEDIKPAKEVIGHNISNRDRKQLRQVVADQYLQAGIEKWGRQYDIVLGGGLIPIYNPYELSAGDINYAMVFSLFPQDHHLMLCSIRGSDLADIFLDPEKTDYVYGLVDDRAIIADDTYYIVTDSYTFQQLSNCLTLLQRYDADIFARDLLAEFIANGGFHN